MVWTVDSVRLRGSRGFWINSEKTENWHRGCSWECRLNCPQTPLVASARCAEASTNLCPSIFGILATPLRSSFVSRLILRHNFLYTRSAMWAKLCNFTINVEECIPASQYIELCSSVHATPSSSHTPACSFSDSDH